MGADHMLTQLLHPETKTNTDISSRIEDMNIKPHSKVRVRLRDLGQVALGGIIPQGALGGDKGLRSLACDLS